MAAELVTINVTAYTCPLSLANFDDVISFENADWLQDKHTWKPVDKAHVYVIKNMLIY